MSVFIKVSLLCLVRRNANECEGGTVNEWIHLLCYNTTILDTEVEDRKRAKCEVETADTL